MRDDEANPSGAEPSAELPDGERCFRLAFETAAVGMAIVSLDGRFLIANRRLTELLGYNEGELDGASASVITHPDDRAHSVATFRQLYAGKIPLARLEKRIYHRTGRLVWAQITVSVVRDAHGKPLYAFHQVEDLTEQKQLRAELMHRERLASVGALAAGVAHEINNPLTYVSIGLDSLVKGLAETELSDVPALPKLRQIVADVTDGTRRIQAIVSDLRAFSRVQTERVESVDLNEIVRIALRIAGHELKYCTQVLENYGDLPPLRGSEGRLCQVFLNLIINAAQAMPQETPAENVLRVTTLLSPDGEATVEIADTGAGIAPGNVDRLFDPFFSTKLARGGSGLGLSICRGIVEAHGGSIRVESEVGKGSCFTVRLPISSTRELRAVTSAPPPRRFAQALRVLVIDDEPAILRAVRLSLPHVAFEALDSARKAIALLETGKIFDAVLCDVMMPGMSGVEFHAWLAQNKPELAEKTLFMTGGGLNEETGDFLTSVRERLLLKPFESRDLDGLLSQIAGVVPLD